MFEAKVYKIAVFSLSGIMDETYAAKECVRRWNADNAEREGKMFLTVDEPQAADVLVGVVDNRLEKTDHIEDGLKAKKQVLLFFNAYSDPKNTIASEQSAVVDYMRQMHKRCNCAKFNGAAALADLLEQQLNLIE